MLTSWGSPILRSLTNMARKKTIEQLQGDLRVVLALERAKRLARAIRSTQERVHGDFMARPTAKAHIDSLRGTAHAEGLLPVVDAILSGAVV